MIDDRDAAIERVLAGLGGAAPPDGLEARILARLDSAKAATEPAERWWSWSRAMGAAWSLAAVGALAVVLVHRSADQPARDDRQPAVQAQTASPQVLIPRGLALQRDIAHARLTRAVTTKDTAPTSEPGALDSKEALAFAEMHAPSLVAPPQPLSEQERLLLRMVDKGGPQELALLNPAMRDLWDAQEKAQFRQFFTPTPVAASAEEANEPPAETNATQPVPPQ